MQLHLIRHTRPAIAPGICYGQTDLPLADSFAADMSAVREKIADIRTEMVYTSPLKRCAHLAESLNLAELRTDPRLMELNFGAWEMCAWDEIPRAALDDWSASYVHAPPPGGEAFTQLSQRVYGFTSELRSRHVAEDVLVVTHAGVIRSLLAQALNLPLKATFRFQLDYGGVTRIDLHDGEPLVVYVNK